MAGMGAEDLPEEVMRPGWAVPAVVAAGGACGALARHLVARVVAATGAEPMLGTMAVNLIGCALLGAAAGLTARDSLLQFALATGFLGAFTTFSTFAADQVQLLQQGRTIAFAVNLLLQNVVGIAVFALVLHLCRGWSVR
jgi:CrcB protein